ncbi:MAG: hypothetical protein RL653_2642 [Pseudomonadota bacterium]|jgi:hypothetical protein
MRRLPLLLLAFCACTFGRPVDLAGEVGSFTVTVTGVFAPGTRTPHRVVSDCASAHGGQAGVPAELRGTPTCPYVIPRGEVDVELTARALSRTGEPLALETPVAFRAVPGDLAAAYSSRWAQMRNGELTATVKAAHLYGEVRLWAEDARPQLLYADGGLLTDGLPEEPARRSYATGASQPLFFEDPTLAKIQFPDGFDNRSSPFVGQFMTLGRRPESGSVQLQSCDDPGPDGAAQSVDGKPVTLVVTGMDPGGFFVTDVSACRVKEDVSQESQVRVPEPDGYLPGTFGSLYVYNYSYPDGLYQGDLIWSVSGAVQEFTSTTQLVFPAWSIRERVHELPVSEWKKNLDLVPIRDLTLRTCGLDDKPEAFLTDTLCGHNRRNLKLESLESSLVRLRNVRFPEVFAPCDRNGDGAVPFFCEGKVGSTWAWQDCDFESNEPGPEADELQCNVDCVTGQGAYAGKRCAERTTYVGFGQYVVTLAPPGPAEAGLDATLSTKVASVTVPAGGSAAVAGPWAAGTPVSLSCTAAATWALGPTAGAGDAALAANSPVLLHLEAESAAVAFFSSAGATCTVGRSPETRISLATRDAIPDLEPDCDPSDADADKAEQCRFTRGATYDVVGHLRQLQPGRPRWAVLPRDADDLCCHPGPGLSCPRPLKACPTGAAPNP